MCESDTKFSLIKYVSLIKTNPNVIKVLRETFFK